MWSTIIAVVGTLAGAVVASVMQQRAARDARAEERAEARRTAVLGAVTELVSALAEHRRAMWVREDLRLSGAPTAEVAAAREESHRTRAAVTAPHTTALLLAPELREAVDGAVRASYALRDAPDASTLSERREAALRASDALVAAAAARLA